MYKYAANTHAEYNSTCTGECLFYFYLFDCAQTDPLSGVHVLFCCLFSTGWNLAVNPLLLLTTSSLRDFMTNRDVIKKGFRHELAQSKNSRDGKWQKKYVRLFIFRKILITRERPFLISLSS